MNTAEDLPLMLWGNAGAVLLLLGLAWGRGAATVGLPLCYVFSLGTIHFVGALIATLPASPVGNTLFVGRGFQECFAGVVAFTSAVLITGFLLDRPRNSHGRSAQRAPAPPDALLPGGGRSRGTSKSGSGSVSSMRRLPLAYLLMGTACALASPLFKAIPSLAALVHCGAYLLVAGFCLGCYLSWRRGRRGCFLAWVACTCVFPAFTILTTGFIGYGVFATLMVLSFALVHYRPVWQTLLALTVMAYFGLSVYVTYMSGRERMRAAVWGGQAYSARLEQLGKVFARFEFFRPDDGAQLQAIDDRLNQNFLVGAACAQLESGVVSWAGGRTIWRAFLAMVPRILWPQKPVVAGGGDLVSTYTGFSFAEFTSVGVGQVMEFYINFGRPGVILGFGLLGVLLRIMDWRAALCLNAGRYGGFVLWYVPGLAFMQTGGSLVEVFGTFAASILVCFAAKHLVLPLGRPQTSCAALGDRGKAQLGAGMNMTRTGANTPVRSGARSKRLSV